ncbi:MAG: glucosidase, partial [Siphonobacter sp.]
MTIEKTRLKQRNDNKGWKKWGPYLAERQWGTVREDYSGNGDAWNFFSHDASRSRAYRWGEDGIGGISDNKGHICFAFSFWNHRDGILKERLFGLTNPESNHGEDVKELYYYLDSTPTHSYMKMLYKYPQQAFPYEKLLQENQRRNREQPEYELADTGIFDKDEYFDIYIEYAKADENDILIKLTVHNRGPKAAPITILPTIWFRNTWIWGYENYSVRPMLTGYSKSLIEVNHKILGKYKLYVNQADSLLFCENETNFERIYGSPNYSPYPKDGINDYIVSNGKKQTINPNNIGTKASAKFTKKIPAGESFTVKLRFANYSNHEPFADFD